MTLAEPKRIGKTGNHYGGVFIKEEDGRFYWGVENWDHALNWEEIPDYLYNALNRYQDELDEARGGKFTALCVRMQIQNGNLCQVGYYDYDVYGFSDPVSEVKRTSTPSHYYMEGRRYEVSMLKSNDLSDEEIQSQARKLIEEKIQTEAANLPPCPH